MPSPEYEELLSQYHELARAHDELTRELRDDLRLNFHVYLGKIALPARLNSTGFSWVYSGLNLFAFAFGIGCIFFGGSWQELGIALVVGGMFGMSAFVAQLLSVQLAVEQHQNDLLWRDERTQKYAPKLAEISEQVQAVREQMRAELDRQSVAGNGGTKNGVDDGGQLGPESPSPRSEGLSAPDTVT